MRTSNGCSTNAIDDSVGAQVWIRERKGSWWPGRVVEKDELAESSQISPKSCTPGKLLGRKSASVDWYNLERSKRVKPPSIGKAKSCGAKDSKKSVKYPRREDAIAQDIVMKSSKHDPYIYLRLHNSPFRENIIDTNDSCDETKESIIEGQELSRSGLSFEEPSQIDASNMQNGWLIDSDDDVIGTRRMRDLDDLSMVMTATIQTTTSCSNMICLPSMKWKRSHGVTIHGLKKKSRCRSLMQVLESSKMVSVPVTSERLASPCKSSFEGICDCFKSNGGTIDAISHGPCESFTEIYGEVPTVSFPRTDQADVLLDVPFVAEGKYSLISDFMNSSNSSTKRHRCSRAWQSTQSHQTENTNEAVAITSFAAPTNSISRSTSRWKSKGKRNGRRVTSNKPMNFHFRKGHVSNHPTRHVSSFHFRKTRPASVLYDVNLEVRANYKPQHVPLVSLMSKLDGKAIVGHPLAIELLKEDQTATAFTKKDAGVSGILAPRLRRCGGAVRKTRKLSLLTACEDRREKNHGVDDGYCVSLDVVFCRLHEALKM